MRYLLLILLFVGSYSYYLNNNYGPIPKKVKKYFKQQGIKKKLPIICEDNLMEEKNYGTCSNHLQKSLRWGGDIQLSDKICCFNRDYAEPNGYWKSTKLIEELEKNKKITFYDTITNKPLFQISNYRDVKDFKEESEKHGWPSFRDGEVIWENVRYLENGEIISIDGTHLGHNIPDKKGNRYCINIVSISGLG